MYDEENKSHFLDVFPDYKYFTIPGHDDIYYGPTSKPWSWKYVGNGLYETTEEYWNGLYPQAGMYTWVSCNIGTSYDTDYDALYGYFPSHSYNYYGEDASGLPVPVIGSGGTVINGIVNSSCVIDVDGEMICAAEVYYRYPGNSTNRWIFTGTTMENLTHYRKKSYFYTNEYEIVKYQALQEKNVFNTVIPGIAYVRNENKVYYNQSSPVIADDAGTPIFEIKSKELIPDVDFATEVSYFHDFLGCGQILIKPEDVETVEVIFSGEEDAQDITDEFKRGRYTEMNIWRRMCFDNESGKPQWNSWLYFSWMKVVFTDEFMKGGKLFGHSQGCTS